MMLIKRDFIFFFSSRRRHTRWPRDLSSDVCSSDLRSQTMSSPSVLTVHSGSAERSIARFVFPQAEGNAAATWKRQIGRASCRERGENTEGVGTVKRESRTWRRYEEGAQQENRVLTN